MSNGHHPLSTSSPHFNGSRAPYKRSDRFGIARQNIRSSSGNGYSSLSATKTINNNNKTKFDFSSVTNGGNDHSIANRHFQTASPRFSSFNKGQHVTIQPMAPMQALPPIQPIQPMQPSLP